ncbi:hypothetical protein GJ496_008870 [Pomphorhynchus laevis]|nr:hypothetical protein GJ496_008870 [Pomphorhynchus laevis]
MNKLTKKSVKSDKVKCTDKSAYFTELVDCSNGECDVWTSMSIYPTQKTLYSNKSLLCGYCSAILLNTITNEHPISHQVKKYATQLIQTSIMENVLEQSNINSLH